MKSKSLLFERITDVFNTNLLVSGFFGTFSIFVFYNFLTVKNGDNVSIIFLIELFIEKLNIIFNLPYPTIIVLFLFIIVIGALIKAFMILCSLVILIPHTLLIKKSVYKKIMDKLFPNHKKLINYYNNLPKSNTIDEKDLLKNSIDFECSLLLSHIKSCYYKHWLDLNKFMKLTDLVKIFMFNLLIILFIFVYYENSDDMWILIIFFVFYTFIFDRFTNMIQKDKLLLKLLLIEKHNLLKCKTENLKHVKTD